MRFEGVPQQPSVPDRRAIAERTLRTALKGSARWNMAMRELEQIKSEQELRQAAAAEMESNLENLGQERKGEAA